MSDNFKAVLKQANNDVTGDAIRTGKGGNEKFAAGWEEIFCKKEEKPLTTCASHRDGDCYHKQCPQLRDDEPKTSGRSCPLFDWDRDYD